jgi:hypothetical protein
MKTSIQIAQDARTALAKMKTVQCIDCHRSTSDAVKDETGWHCLPCRYPRRRPNGLDLMPVGANISARPYDLSAIEGSYE